MTRTRRACLRGRGRRSPPSLASLLTGCSAIDGLTGSDDPSATPSASPTATRDAVRLAVHPRRHVPVAHRRSTAWTSSTRSTRPSRRRGPTSGTRRAASTSPSPSRPTTSTGSSATRSSTKRKVYLDRIKVDLRRSRYRRRQRSSTPTSSTPIAEGASPSTPSRCRPSTACSSPRRRAPSSCATRRSSRPSMDTKGIDLTFTRHGLDPATRRLEQVLQEDDQAEGPDRDLPGRQADRGAVDPGQRQLSSEARRPGSDGLGEPVADAADGLDEARRGRRRRRSCGAGWRCAPRPSACRPR